MEKEKIIFISIILVLILGALGLVVYYQLYQANLFQDNYVTGDEILVDDDFLFNDDEAVFCPMDVMECADGSFVGRIPPTCEFAECPDLDDSSQEINEIISFIDNFDSCVGAGFAILETFPEQCLTPDGRVFINE